MTLAEELVHEGQRYTPGVPYMRHVAAVARLARRTARRSIPSPDFHRQVEATAWLHDSVEESLWPGWSRQRHTTADRPFVDLSYLLEAGIPKVVAVAAIALTPRPNMVRPVYRQNIAYPSVDLFQGVSDRDDLLAVKSFRFPMNEGREGQFATEQEFFDRGAGSTCP